MSMTTPIVDFVRSYAQSGTARLHMPGHKGQSLLGFEPLDITEICGADELYAPEGIIAESEANATRLFGTAHSYYSTEGSSQCIRAMLFLALQGAPQNGKRPVLLAARNAHKALLYAAALLDFDIRWLWPSAQAEGTLCSCPVTAEALTAALHALAQQGISPFGVYVTSPDYLGGMQDIPALAAVCRAQGVPLLVDNAHGAYLRFLPQNCHPIAQGAAMCCDSGHKTLPVVTGGAYLHLAHDAPVQDEAAVRGALALFGSTSPSYLILQSLDACNAVLAGDYPARLAQCCATLESLRRSLNALAAAARHGPAAGTGRGRPGTDEADAGRRRAGPARAQRWPKPCARTGWNASMPTPAIVLMFTPENPAEDFARLETALAEALCSRGPPDRPARAPGGICALAAAGGAAPDRAAGRVWRTGAHPGRSLRWAGSALCLRCPARPPSPLSVSGEVDGPAALELFAAYGVETVSVVKPEKF